MNSIHLTLPYPPGLNNIYRTLILPGKKMPIRVKTGEAKKYHTAVGKVCQEAQAKPFIGEVQVELRVYRPRRVGDLDGTFKIIFDALKGHAYNDDGQIVEIHARRFEDKFQPRVEIEIKPLGIL